MLVRLKAPMFFITTTLMEKLLKKKQKCFEFVLRNRIKLLFLHLCVKSEVEEQRSHKVVTVMSIEFYPLPQVLLGKSNYFNPIVFPFLIFNMPDSNLENTTQNRKGRHYFPYLHKSIQFSLYIFCIITDINKTLVH